MIASLLLALAFSVTEPDFGRLQGLGTVHQHTVTDESLDQTWYVFVRLPAGYEAGEERYPAVYLLDGGIHFPMLGTYAGTLRMAEQLPDVIVVGISYGTNDWREGNQRSRDFTAPTEERESWGGAERFRDVFRDRFLPLVESAYRADPERRVIFGQSLGGQFVLDTALAAPDLFHGYIASNPALHRNLDHFLERPATAPDGDRPRVFLVSAAQDAPRFRVPAMRWIEERGGDELPWELAIRTDLDHDHFSVSPEAFRLGLRWILVPPAAD